MFTVTMSAAVMSNFNYYMPMGSHMADHEYRAQNWMLAQMAQYPPPLPFGEQQHYNALYPAPTGAQQMLDPQPQMQYSNLAQPAYSKVETTTTPEQPPMHQQAPNLTQQLQQHAALAEQQQQHYSPQQGQEQQVSTSNPATQQNTPDQSQKSNRLRKACDSCSIRKVKVSSR